MRECRRLAMKREMGTNKIRYAWYRYQVEKYGEVALRRMNVKCGKI